MLLSEYLKNNNIDCETDLQEDVWEELLNSDPLILERLYEWKDSKLVVKLNTVSHADSRIRTPYEKGYTHAFYDSKINMYKTYDISITRRLAYTEDNMGSFSIGYSSDAPVVLAYIFKQAEKQRRDKKIKEDSIELIKNFIQNNQTPKGNLAIDFLLEELNKYKENQYERQ